ncbi:ankyrin [Zopfia rhizophila CBS 207.26]|uniref:Ankyrin n=1 Tax=Zopfia rhizophila CBS 207.26 TaxID=1314779 RepID=A0A6A6DUU8_9PEZI|nr:ankyrin [Zopfia rhizophila CBS 207.26]
MRIGQDAAIDQSVPSISIYTMVGCQSSIPTTGIYRQSSVSRCCTRGLADFKEASDKYVRITDQTANGNTLLHIAASENQMNLVKELLRYGADVNASNDQSETPLHIAVAWMCDYDISRCLISSGADLLHQDLDTTIRGADGMTIAHYVSFTKQSSRADMIRSLGPDPSDIHTTDHDGRTILHLAIRRGNFKLIDYLFEQNTEALEQPDHDGRTLMHYATESRRSTQLIDLLYRRGFSIRAKDKTGRTVLHHAASKGNLTAITKLLE